MKRIKDVASGISLSIAALFLVLIMHVVTAHAEQFLFKFGSYGTGDGQFNGALGVAVDSSGNIYVADQKNNRIQVFDTSGNYLRKFGTVGTGDGQFNWPSGVAVDSSGNICVADDFNHRIQVFDTSGNFLRKFGSWGTGNGQFKYPHGVAVDSSGNIYVADTENDRIQVFDSSGNYLRKFGSSGTGDGQFQEIHGVAVDSSGNIYVADYVNHRIQVFDTSGNYLRKFGSLGTGDGQFNGPIGVAVNSSGNIYVADANNYRIQVFDAFGTFLRKFGSLGTGDGQFDYPTDVAVDSSGNISVADYGNHRIQVFGGIVPTPTPSPTATLTPTPTGTATATVTPTPPQECVQPPSDMVGWWPLDETQGPTANDIAGSFNNDGTWTNSPGTATGKVAGALSFNGSNYVEVGPAQTEINFQTGDFSIDVWVQTVGSQSTRTLVDKRTKNPQGNVIRGYHLYLYNGKPGLQLADGSYTNYNSTASTAFVADGNWHHIAVTVDRNNTAGLNIYVDSTSTASLDPTAHAGNLTNSAPLVFGGKNLITPSFTFVGALDELELFNRALTQTEIQDIYNAGSAGKCKPTPTPVGTGTVFGWVEDADEEPLEGVTVAIKGELSDSTETDEDGYYEFGGLPKGNYTITYEKEGYRTQTQDVSLNEGEEKELDTVTMEQIVTGEIYGYVVDINGNPLESVSLRLKGVKTKVKQTASSDADGFFEFTDLEADTYIISAKKKGYRNTQQKVKLGDGESEEIEIVMNKTSKRVLELMKDGQGER